MAANRIKGITIEIDGNTTKLQDSLKDVDKQLKTTQTNLRDINKLLKLDPKNTELLAQKQKTLKEAIELTKKRLNELKTAQTDALSPEQYDALQREIIETENNLKSLETEYDELSTSAETALEKAGQSITETGEKVTKAGQSIKKAGDGISGVGQKIMPASLAMAGLGAAAVKTASDYEENLNKIDVAFGDSAKEVKDWSDNAMKEFGLSKVAASDATSSFGALAKGVGVSEKEAAGMATTLAGLTSDLSSYFNVGTDESAKALEAIFTGESESLKKFGVVMTETNLKQFAKDHGLVYSELSQLEKTQLRYNYVLEKTKDAQGDYSRTSSGTANSLKTFSAALADLGVAIGTQLLPIITPVVQQITELVNTIANLPKPVQEMIVKIGLIVAVAGPLLVTLGSVVSSVGSIITVGGKLMTGMGTLTKAISAGGGLISAITSLGTAIAPFLIGGAIIVGIIAAITLIVKNWDTIKKGLANLWKGIQTFAGNVVKGVKDLGGKIAEGIGNIKTAIGTKMNEIKTVFGTIWGNIKTQFSQTWQSIKENIQNNIQNMLTSFSNFKTKVANVFGNILTAITSPFRKAWEAITGFVEKIKNAFKFKIELPKIKLPHIEVKWNKIGDFFKIPTLSVKWYKRAYENPMMFNRPTVLQTPYGAKGFGDGSGGEIVYGRNNLMRDIRAAVGDTGDITINVYGAEGQNVNQLADAVSKRLTALQKQRQAAYV